MKQFFLTLFLSLTASVALAQSDPVLMTVGHFQVTRSEFEYAYNKNAGTQGAVEETTPEEYAEMYLNYKLKVLAAEAAGLDTVGALLTEFRTYRDMQLMNYLVDQAFIDSVARSQYDLTVEFLQGKDILYLSHILLLVPADATAEQKSAIGQRADSLYKVLIGGADFAAIAQQYSQDPGSARFGGQIRPVGPGELVKEFEDAAYALPKGQISKPVLTPYGYHIILMRDRKQLEPYEEVYDQLVTALKRQNIEEQSAEHRIQQLIAQSGGTLTREAILDSVMQQHVGDDANLRYLIQEYREGLMLYDIAQNRVWKPAANDADGLQNYFQSHRGQYAWDTPHFKGYIVQAKSKKVLKKAVKFVKNNAGADNLSELVNSEFNTDGVQVRVSKLIVCAPGENTTVDRLMFKGNSQPLASFPYERAVGQKIKQPESYEDVAQQVVADYQQELERQWVEELRSQFPYHINTDVLQTVNNHD